MKWFFPEQVIDANSGTSQEGEIDGTVPGPHELMVFPVSSVSDVEEGVFDGPVGSNDREQGERVWVDQAGDVSDSILRFRASFFVDEASSDDGDRARARKGELSWRQGGDANGARLYSSMSKLCTPLW